MSQITGGVYSYLRVVKDDDFGIKREFKAELSFTVGEDDPTNDIGAKVAQQVVDIVHEKLRIKSAPASVPGAVETKVTGSPPPPASPAPVPAKTDKEKLADEVIERAGGNKRRKAPVIEATPAPADDADIFGDEPVAPAAPITDKELNERVQAKNATLKNPPLIRELKEKYVGPLPKRVIDIPQEKRAAFLHDLDALK